MTQCHPADLGSSRIVRHRPVVVPRAQAFPIAEEHQSLLPARVHAPRIVSYLVVNVGRGRCQNRLQLLAVSQSIARLSVY